MSAFIKSLFVVVSVITLLVLYVVVEVIVAMFAYMYLALNHVETFGTLVSFSRDVLNLFANQLEHFFPELANRAYTTLLGELGPKSILLLLIGLIVSALGRLISWLVRRWIHGARLGLPSSIR
ncbi:MAG: hypothetical protein ACR2OF_02695 [Hyphomicrobium sp.]